jgi:hypothetical protein
MYLKEEKPMSADDFLSPFEELVLTALLEAGWGALDVSICRGVRKLARRNRITFPRVKVALMQLENDHCVYSWPEDRHSLHGEAPLRHYRVQFRGQRALDAAIERRGGASSIDYFHRASRIGVLWDLCTAFKSRFLSGRRIWQGYIDGRGEKV